jgi:hypothetical protein
MHLSLWYLGCVGALWCALFGSFVVRFAELAIVRYSPNPDSANPVARFVMRRSVWVLG